MRWPAKTGTVVGDGESRKGRGRRLGSTGNGEKMKGKKKFAELQYDYSTRCSSFRKLRLQEEFTSSSKSFVREVYEFSSFFLFFCVCLYRTQNNTKNRRYSFRTEESKDPFKKKTEENNEAIHHFWNSEEIIWEVSPTSDVSLFNRW